MTFYNVRFNIGYYQSILEVEFSCEGGNSLVGPAMFVSPPIIFLLSLFCLKLFYNGDGVMVMVLAG